MEDKAYLKIENLKVTHRGISGSRTVLNIDELSIEKGETFGIVGESGTGKTLLALTILKLLEMPPGHIDGGRIYLNSENLLDMSAKEMRQKVRGKRISMIFQDPMSTLNPVFTVGQQMIPVLCENQKADRKKARRMAVEMLNKVKLPDAERIMDKYPHELSGGQRQRVIIALALVCKAELIIADEPTRNLDVTIQAGILRLIKDLQREYKMTVMFISNNPSLISIMCDKAAVIYGGEIVEKGTSEEVMLTPLHPYTKTLLNALPQTETMMQKRGVKKGWNYDNGGCIYMQKCFRTTGECCGGQSMIKVNGSHYVKCHLAEGGRYNE